MDKDTKIPAGGTLVMHDFGGSTPAHSMGGAKLIIALIVVVLFGIGTGFLLSRTSGALPSVGTNSGSGSSASSSLTKGTILGTDDTKTFKDTAEGKLEEGGIEGEGQFHLVRPGGESQNVYMTSSIIDLSQLVGKKVKVWGETQTAQHAG